jgi:hypothetical protein
VAVSRGSGTDGCGTSLPLATETDNPGIRTVTSIDGQHAEEDLPCSGGERRILQLSASLAGGIPVDLRDAVTGLDDRNTALIITAIQRAAGRRT